MALEEADGNRSLVRTMLDGGNRGEAGDAWGVIRPGVLSNVTSPASRLNDGSVSSVTFHDVRIEDGTARLFISTATLVADRLLQSFLESDAAPLSNEERLSLDRAGNANGHYDIGDLRQYLQENPSVGTSGVVTTSGH